jgi:N-methylhydantoinase B/oxoprolinase/acetone carboxylase alpha subunit
LIQGEAIFDFTGTGYEVYGSCNAPPAVTMAAVIYCLRCLVGHEIPLNQGCLTPIKVDTIAWIEMIILDNNTIGNIVECR